MSDERVRHPLYELTRSHLLEVTRELGVIFWVFGFPILLAIVLGIAFRSRGPEKAEVAVIGDEGRRARAVEALSASPDLSVRTMTAAEAAEALRKAKVTLIVDVGTNSSTVTTYRFDPLQPESRIARLAAEDALERAAGRKDLLAAADVREQEHGRRYIDYLLPGLLGLNLMGSSLWGIGYAIVDARARKLMKRIAATPVRRAYYLASFALSRFVLLILEVIILVAFGAIAFDVHVQGSLLELGFVAMFGAASFAGLSLLVAARPSRPEVASGWMNALMMPMWLLSGSLFSYERYPEIFHPFLRILPLTALNDALRAIVNDGASVTALGPQLLVLAVWGSISFVLALRWFRWQ
jgi:ABC-2 type transport system permease protein